MPLICNLVLPHSPSFLKFPNLEDSVTWYINQIAIEKKRIYSSRVSSKLLNVLICSKFAKYFPKEYHLTKKSKKKDKVIILNDILRLTYIRMYHKFISFYVTCINYRNVVSHINYCNDVLRQPEFAGWNSLLIQKLAVRLTQQSHEGMRVRQIILLVSLLDYDALIKKCMIINCENYSRGKRALVPKIEKATRRIM